jgi:inner membrane protein
VDSLSQIVLGAACGELLLGKKIGNKAQLIGAIAGTIPDLDVFINPFFTDEIVKLQIHRSYSHSMFIHLLLALPFAWLTYVGFRKKVSYREWYIMWLAGFITHTLLDCCTTYGTQLFLPFTNFLVGFNNVAVVDPFWTVPFMIMLIICLFIKRENPKRIKFAYAAVGYALLYMAYTCVNKYNVHQTFTAELNRQNIHVDELSTSPSMFNNWLWAGIAITPDTIYCGEYSVLQEEKDVEWVAYPRHLELLENHPAMDQIKVLQWFSQGKYFVEEVGDELHFFIVKWGRMDFSQRDAHKAFVFHWRLYMENGQWKSMPIEPHFGGEEFNKAWKQLWHRVKTSAPLAIQ